MSDAAAELQILISAQDEATPAFEQLQENLTQITGAADEAGAQMSEAFDKIAPAADAAATATADMATAAGDANTAATELGTASGEAATGLADVDTIAAQLVSAMASLDSTIAALNGRLSTTSAAAPEAATGLDEVGASATANAGEVTTFSDSMTSAKESLDATKVAMGAFMAIAGAGILGGLVDKAEKTAIALDRLQSETGLSAQGAERLAVEASGAGVSIDRLNQTVGRMDARMEQARSGSASLSKLLYSLGISAQAFTNANPSQQAKMLTDGLDKANLPAKQLDSTLKSLGVNSQKFLAAAPPQRLTMLAGGLQEVQNSGQAVGRMLQDAGINASTFMKLGFEQKLSIISDAFDHMKNRAEATALVVTVFGKQGTQLIPLIQNFSELDAYAKQLKMPVMNTKEITLAAEKTQMLVTMMEMMADSVLVKVLPLVDDMGKAFYDLATNITSPGKAIGDFVRDLGPVPAAITATVMAFEGVKIVNAMTRTVTEFGSGISAVVTRFISWADALDANTAAQTANAAATEGETAATSEAAVATEASSTGWLANTGILAANAASKAFAAIATGTVTAATTLATAATVAWSAVTSTGTVIATAFGVAVDIATGPIGIMIAVAAALAVGIYELVTHWKAVETFLRGAWDSFMSWAMALWNDLTKFLVKWWPELLGALGGPVGIVAAFLITHWTQIKEDGIKAWDDLTGGIGNVLHGMESTVEGIIGGIVATVEGAWRTISSIASDIGNIVSGIEHAVTGAASSQSTAQTMAGGKPLNVPHMATGGIVSSPTLALVGESGPEAVLPLSQYPIMQSAVGPLGAMSGGQSAATQIVINVSGNIARSEQDLANTIAAEFQRRMKFKAQLA